MQESAGDRQNEKNVMFGPRHTVPDRPDGGMTAADLFSGNFMPPGVSIIIPTFREEDNIPRLTPELVKAMAARDWEWEVIFVDDNSPDQTPQILAEMSRRYPQVRYIIRTQDRGLSSAVLAGFELARFDYLLVMDADLSHPPESVPSLIEPLVENRADFVIGSRYVAGGRTEDWGPLRWLNSFVATVLSRPFVGPVKDSMAGFFALRRATLLAGDELNPIGYKIGLELMVKCQVTKPVETPIVFRNRVAGESKLTMREQFRYLEHLSRLYDYRFPRGSGRVKFLIAAACGIAAAAGIIGLFYGLLHASFSLALPLGLIGMILVTLVFFARFVSAQRDFILMRHPYREFLLISIAECAAGLTVGLMLFNRQGIWLAMAGAFGALVVIRYVLRKIFQHDVRGVRRRKPKSGEPNRFLRQQVHAATANPEATPRAAKH